MGCNCKTKKVKGKVVEVDEDDKDSNILYTFVSYILLSILVTLLLPMIWIVLLRMIYKSSYGEGWDVGNTITNIFTKKEPDEKNNDSTEDINPNDYEVVGVEKIV